MDEVLIDPNCYECGGTLEIVEQDASSLIVMCAQCGSSYGMEVATGRDGNPVYWPRFRVTTSGGPQS